MSKFSHPVKWKLYPTTSLKGYFAPLGNLIYLGEFKDSEEFNKVISNPSSNIEGYCTYIHEYQHYQDSISTFWGLENLFKISSAFHSAFRGQEKDYYRLQDIAMAMKKDVFNSFYTEYYNENPGSFQSPWRFRLTIGNRYTSIGDVDTDKPIALITFYDNSDIFKICRMPISIASLLEANAMAVELANKINLLNQIDPKYKIGKLNALNEELERRLYSHEYALYSLSVHVVSVYLKIYDPITAYRITSNFASIALNIPRTSFCNIIIPEDIKQNEELYSRSIKLLQNCDRGYAFFLLVRNYLDRFGILSERININNILEASGLPNEEDLIKEFHKEVYSYISEAQKSNNAFLNTFIYKTITGTAILNSRGIALDKHELIDSSLLIDKPYLVFSSTDPDIENIDAELLINEISKGYSPSFDEWYKVYSIFEQKIDAFSDICGL